MTQLQEADTLIKLFTYANDSIEGILLGLFMIGIFFVMMFTLKKWDFEDSLLSTSFICFVLSAVLTYAKLLNFIYPLGFGVMMAFTAFYMYVVKR